jgi:hypothetical protein
VRAGGLSKRPVEVDVGHDALALTGVALCAIDPSAFRFARFALTLAGHSHLVGGNDVVAEADEHTDQSGGPATTPQDPAFAVSRTVPGCTPRSQSGRTAPVPGGSAAYDSRSSA